MLNPSLMDCESAEKRIRWTLMAYQLTLFTLLVLMPGVVFGQDATPTPTPSEEELRLQEEKRIIELKRDIELAKKAIREAQPQPPAPTATPLEGKTELDENVQIETTMVSYKAMSDVANDISREIRVYAGRAKNIAIYDKQVVKDWRFYQALYPAFEGQTSDISDAYMFILCDPASGSSNYFRRTYCVNRGGEPFSMRDSAQRRALKPEAVESAILEGSTLIKSFIDLAALFRTDTTIAGKVVKIEQDALVAETFRALKRHFACHQKPTADPCEPRNISLYYPAVFPPRVDAKDSDTIARIGLLSIFKQEAERIIKDKTGDRPIFVEALNQATTDKNIAQAKLDQILELESILNNLIEALRNETVGSFRQKLWIEIHKVTVEKERLGSKEKWKAAIDQARDQIIENRREIKQRDDSVKLLTDLNERFQNLVDQLVKVDADENSTLALFIKSEQIEKIMKDDPSYWLEIKPLNAGGNNRTRKNLIWFFLGARADHSGGVVAEYTLYDTKGAVIYSDKRAYYEGYIEPRNIQRGKLVDVVK